MKVRKDEHLKVRKRFSPLDVLIANPVTEGVSGWRDSLVTAKKCWCRGLKNQEEKNHLEVEHRLNLESISATCWPPRLRRSLQSPLTSSQGRSLSPIHLITPPPSTTAPRPRPLTPTLPDRKTRRPGWNAPPPPFPR